MPQIARVTAPGGPPSCDVTGKQPAANFFCDDEYRAYLELMAQWCSHCTWAREVIEPQASKAKTRAKTQLKN